MEEVISHLWVLLNTFASDQSDYKQERKVAESSDKATTKIKICYMTPHESVTLC